MSDESTEVEKSPTDPVELRAKPVLAECAMGLDWTINRPGRGTIFVRTIKSWDAGDDGIIDKDRPTRRHEIVLADGTVRPPTAEELDEIHRAMVAEEDCDKRLTGIVGVEKTPAEQSIEVLAQILEVLKSFCGRIVDLVKPLKSLLKGKGDGPRKPMTLGEASPKVRDYMADHPKAPVREVAKAVGCSTGTVRETQPWKATMAQRRQARKLQSPRVEALSDKVLASQGKDDDPSAGMRHDELVKELMPRTKTPGERAALESSSLKNLEELAAVTQEQRQDSEPSPIDDDRPGSRPKTSRTHKKL